MQGIYILIASILFYLAIVRAFASQKLSILFSSALVVFVPLIISKTVQGVLLVGFHIPLANNLFTWRDLAIIILQFALALYVFYRLQQDEDSLTSWFSWNTAGAVGIYLFIPYLVSLVLH